MAGAVCLGGGHHLHQDTWRCPTSSRYPLPGFLRIPWCFFLWRKKMPGTRKSGGDVVFSGFCFFLSMYALYILQKQKCTCRCKLHVFCFTMKTKTDLRIFRVIDGSHFTGRISYDSWSRSWQNVTETNRTLYYLVCVCVCVIYFDLKVRYLIQSLRHFWSSKWCSGLTSQGF